MYTKIKKVQFLLGRTEVKGEIENGINYICSIILNKFLNKYKTTNKK